MNEEIIKTNKNEIIVKETNNFIINALSKNNLPTENLLVAEADRIAI